VYQVSYNPGSCLPAGECSGASRVQRLQILPPYREGSGAATACPAVSSGPRVSSVKKSLAGLPVQLATHVPDAPDVRVIMGLQDVRTCGYSAASALWTTRLAPL
jgi:hypothetical protein